MISTQSVDIPFFDVVGTISGLQVTVSEYSISLRFGWYLWLQLSRFFLSSLHAVVKHTANIRRKVLNAIQKRHIDWIQLFKFHHAERELDAKWWENEWIHLVDTVNEKSLNSIIMFWNVSYFSEKAADKNNRDDKNNHQKKNKTKPKATTQKTVLA